MNGTLLFKAAMLLGLLLTGCGGARPLAGILEGDRHWQGTVRIDGDLVLAEGSRLTIAPGTEVVFLPASPGRDELTLHPNFPGSELIVRGTLIAEGTAAAPIVFRYLDPAGPPGSWGGINLAQSPDARFRFCRFTQADSAVHCQEAKVTVRDCLFENNLVGIRFFSTALVAENNLLRRNGTAIRFHFGAPVIRYNDIVDNRRAFFFTSHPEDFLIEFNNILGSSEYTVVLGEEVPDDVPMPRNYWGPGDSAALAEHFYDGRRSAYLGTVRIEPRLAQPVAEAGLSWKP